MKTKVWAHRGASAYAPENTLEAFLLAAEQGADGVELDVQLTKDGEMVVVHDEEIDRVSDGSGFVKDYTLAELKTLNFNKTHPEYQDVKIPTLREVYEALKPTGMTINVELKTGIFWYKDLEKKVLELTKEMEMEDRVIYSSFNHYSIAKNSGTGSESQHRHPLRRCYLRCRELCEKNRNRSSSSGNLSCADGRLSSAVCGK